MFLMIANFIDRIYELNLNNTLKMSVYILDCSMLSRIMAPNIMNKNIVLNSNTCRSSWPSNIEKGIQ